MRRLWISIAGVLALAALLVSGVVILTRPASAYFPTSTAGPAVTDDGLDKVPPLLRGLSYNTLVAMGRAHYPTFKPTTSPSGWQNPLQLVITWGAEHNTSAVGAGEPATGMHPTNGNYAMVSGNITLDNTTDGGNTWNHRNPPNASGYGDVVNGWLEGGPGPSGANALEVALNPSSDGADYTCGRSTDFGVTWAADAACTSTLRTTFFDDREYLWTDHNPASPFFGRVYLTGALFDSGGSGSYNSVTIRWSSDNGTS